MAMPRKSVSAKQPEGETGLEHKWWRTPAIIVAIIGGIFAIGVALIQRTAPKPKLSEPTKIEQQTHGSDSPAVGQTGGNVTIQHQGNGEKR
jgi:heme/copper-type cytochrome/quinol oxidase subunit 2